MTKHCDRRLTAEFYYPQTGSDNNLKLHSFTFWSSAKDPKDLADIAIRNLKEYYASRMGVSAGGWWILQVWGKDITGYPVKLATRFSRNCPDSLKIGTQPIV